MWNKDDSPTILKTKHQSVHTEWEIPQFFELSKKENIFLDSPSFFLSDSEFYIRIYPPHSEKLVMYFVRKSSAKELSVSFTLGIKKADGSVFRSFSVYKVFSNEENWWIYPPLAKSEIFDSKDILSDDTLVVFCSIETVLRTGDTFTAEAATQTEWTNGLETLSQSFKDLFLSKSYGDITFKVKDKDFLAHKSVLAARSTVFHAMLQTDMVERNHGTIDILDSDPTHFEKFLLYLYSGDLEVVTFSNAFGLYLLGDKYSLIDLKKAACKCLIHNISIDSFCDIAVLASLHDDIELLDTATEFFSKYANIIIKTLKWASFNTEHFALANEFLIKMTDKFLK